MVTARAVTLKDSMKGENRMVRKGFKMFLNPGMAEEYEKRHNELWPEMKEMIHQYGGHNYSIFLDRETNVLYGYLEVEDEGGTIWLTSWKPVQTTVRYAWILYQCFI